MKKMEHKHQYKISALLHTSSLMFNKPAYSTDILLIFHRHLTDIPPTIGQYSTDTWLIFYQHFTNISSLLHRYIAGYTWLTCDWLSSNCRPIVNWLSTDYLLTINRLSVNISDDTTHIKHDPKHVAQLFHWKTSTTAETTARSCLASSLSCSEVSVSGRSEKQRKLTLVYFSLSDYQKCLLKWVC